MNMDEGSTSTTKKRIPIEEGLFHEPVSSEEEPYLVGSRCSLCGCVTFPKMQICPRCAKKDVMVEEHLCGRGKIDTFTIVNAALPGFKAPCIQAYVTLEDGPRIWTLITGVEAAEKALKIGMDVQLVVEKVREDAQGNEVVSYQFRPAKEQSGRRAT
jgi:uncharacterized OB-fold protein